MTENKPSAQDLEFDEIELHSDINVHQPEKPPVQRRPVAKSSRKDFVFMTLLALAALGAAGYLYYRFDLLTKEHAMLQSQVNDATNSLEQSSSELTKVATDLDQTTGSLQQAETNITKLQDGLQRSQKQIAELNEENRKLKASVKSKSDDLQNSEKARNRVEGQLSAAQKKVNRLSNEADRYKKQLLDQKKSAEAKLADLENGFNEKETSYRARIVDLEEKSKNLQAGFDRITREKEQFQKQFQDESKASFQIIQEQSALVKQNSELKQQLRTLSNQLTQTKEENTKLKEVSFGELVPFSENVVPGKITYREPFPDGVKIPRKLGAIVVQALITEVGSVEKAFILSGQELDATAAAGLLRAIYKWKFTPPTLDSIRVKTWQPLLVRPE